MIHYEVEWFHTYAIERFCFPRKRNWFHEKHLDPVSKKRYILGFVVAVQLIKGAVKHRFLKCNLSTLSAVVQPTYVFIYQFLIILKLAVMIIGLTRCRCL